MKTSKIRLALAVAAGMLLSQTMSWLEGDPETPTSTQLAEKAWSTSTGVKPVDKKEDDAIANDQIRVVLRPEGLKQETAALLKQDAIPGISLSEKGVLLSEMGSSALVHTPTGIALYNLKRGTLSFGRTYVDGLSVDLRGVALSAFKVVESRRGLVKDVMESQLNDDSRLNYSGSDKASSDPFSENLSKDVKLTIDEDLAENKGLTGPDDSVGGQEKTIKLTPEQNKKYIQLMNKYLKKKDSVNTESDTSQNEGSYSSTTNSGSDRSKTNDSKRPGSSLASSQINVADIKESNTAVFYKNSILPKAGFDKEGNAMTSEVKANQVKAIMNRIKQAGDKWSIYYPAKGETRKTIAIFGDPTCPVCTELHKYIDDLQSAGVEIYYLFYNRQLSPRTVGSPKATAINTTMQNIWCADDSAQALTQAFENHGQYNEYTDCSDLEKRGKSDFPGNGHFLIGRLINMEGTPYTITDDGKILNGFARGAPQPVSFLRRLGL